MPGETTLATLLRSLKPQLHSERFVFCTLPALPDNISGAAPVSLFYEAEGVTLIVPKARAIAQGWPYTYDCRQITLTVHSSLEAIGLLAAVTTALAAEGISVNPVSAYYHDHLFVPADRAEEAMACLNKLATAPAW